jgi:flagellar biosynthetic protein FliR
MSFCFYESIFTHATELIVMDAYHLTVYVLHELVIGLMFGMLFNLIFDAIVTYAQLIGIQMGQSSANIFNPAIESPTNAIAILYSNIGLFFFLSLNGLPNICLILRKSFEIIPLASFKINIAGIAQNFTVVFGQIFLIGLKFLLPVIALMFIVDIFVAIFSKILPQANMYFLVMSNKLIIGMFVMLVIIQGYYLNLESYFANGIFDSLERLFE